MPHAVCRMSPQVIEVTELDLLSVFFVCFSTKCFLSGYFSEKSVLQV